MESTSKASISTTTGNQNPHIQPGAFAPSLRTLRSCDWSPQHFLPQQSGRGFSPTAAFLLKRLIRTYLITVGTVSREADGSLGRALFEAPAADTRREAFPD